MKKFPDSAKRLYAMEDGFMKAAMHARAPRWLLQAFADAACNRWHVPPVDVVFSRGTTYSGVYFGDENKIRLYAPRKKSTDRKRHYRSGRNPQVLLHEVAHHIDDWKVNNSDGADAHGANFVAITMDLYDHFSVLPKAAFKMLAKKAKIKIAAGIHHKMKKRAKARRRK